MLLALDVGNTNIVIGFLDESGIRNIARLETDRDKTAHEYAISLRQVIEFSGIAPENIDGAILSSVVPPINGALIAAVRMITGIRPLVVGPGMKTGLNIALDNPATMGSDLVVGAAAALAIHDPPLIIIDMGTATTMTVIDREARVLGGAIIPGVGISLEALANGTSQLPHISLDFIFGWPQGVNAEGGIWPTIVSTVYVTALAMLICTPVAVLAAVYLAEYAKQGKVVDIIRYAADALASVPSIVMGLFGYALFVEAMGLGLSMVSAALALALLMLPIVMRTTEEAIRAVPRYIRWGAYGLGATKWQVVSKIVLPSAFGRIATGIVLAIGRAIGETAVVLYTMGQAINLPISPLDSGRPMTVHLYLLANDGINMNAAYGTALLLMAIILAFNLFARYLSRKRR